MRMPSQNSTRANTLLVFDAQLTSLTTRSLQKLRSSLSDNERCAWVSEVILSLPKFWQEAVKAIPKLKDLPAPALLDDLAQWTKSGDLKRATFPLPNVLLTPITIITELVQYTAYLESEDLTQKDLARTHETLGFCTGLLSAFAISSSATEDDLKKNGAVAIRLAVLIGALVDLRNDVEGDDSDWNSVSVGWSNEKEKNQVDKIVEKFPEAYISVSFDENRVTMTSPKAATAKMMEQLTAAGLILKKIDLRGQFHCDGHREIANLLIRFCESHPEVQFPNAEQLVLATRENVQGTHIQEGKLHQIAVEGILTAPSNWYRTSNAALSALPQQSSSRVICFGLARAIPPSLLGKFGVQVVLAKDYKAAPKTAGSIPYTYPKDISGDEIAVIGLSAKVAGADDLEEFWNVLCKAESQHTEVKDDFRFNFKTVFREETKRKWYGNFIADADAFDHKFWRKSPREAASTDPQQRLMMSVALQAVIQAGYFHSATLEDHHVGCYLGIGNVDYEENINHHEPTAFMATGNLRSFIAGKISHALGWTGPAVTIDTACSSSGVAVHQACKAILSGECTAALAGGAAIMTSPRMFQDLAAASFLSQTGPCKSFDGAADGYCRGDGVGAVMLKKMSQAIADGDQIYGVIASTAVYQNQNCTAITVPNAKSLSGLFGDVARQALVNPADVTFVEAHGTGTQVGDPAEYDGVRRVFGGEQRKDVLSVGSVKSVVGHTEGAAGIISLIKMLLMMNEGTMTPQANFKAINPSINSQPSDKMEVSTRLRSWDAPFRVGMINSYGASGSNSSMMVTQAPQPAATLALQSTKTDTTREYPFWFCGLDERSVQAYAAKFLGFLMADSISKKGRSIANLSFNNARQTNRWLPRALVFSCTSTDELVAKLSSYVNGDADGAAITRNVIHPETRPIILSFGGQISTFVGLDKDLYDNIKLLRENLDHCDAICQSLGLESIFPGIFQRTPIEDTVKLQVTLFSMQYATAKSWIDCGLQISALVGHSFGELTALAVSGILTIEDTIQLVSGRSRLIRDSWGSDKGAMMAVEGSVGEIMRLITTSNATCEEAPAATIACYNGPTSFTLAGSTASIDAFEKVAAQDATGSKLKTKRLNVTNAFHSTLVQPLLAELETVAEGLDFKEPAIHLERAIETPSGEILTPGFVADHLRNPVFFHHAVERLSQKYPNAVWLEAGSNSTITSMAKRALGSPAGAHFQPMNLTSDGSWGHLADATMKLWKEGINVPFWPHHAKQTADYYPLILPPYQFEKVSHWLGRKAPPQAQIQAAPQPAPLAAERPRGLWSFNSYRDTSKKIARFGVNTTSEEFAELVAGAKIVSQTPSAPVSGQLHIVLEAILSLQADGAREALQPEIHEFQSHDVLAVDKSRACWLDAESIDSNSQVWRWQILYESTDGKPSPCASGTLVFQTRSKPSRQNGFENYERLIKHSRCTGLLEHLDADAGLQGRNIYRTFDAIIKYGDQYRGLQKVTCKGNESAGRFAGSPSNKYWMDVALADGFTQVSNLFVNCMADAPDSAPWFVSRIEQWLRSTKPTTNPSPDKWDIFSTHHRESEDEWVADVYVFDSGSGALAEIILGLHFRKDRSTAVVQETPVAAPPPAKENVPKPVIETPAPVQTEQAPEAPPQSTQSDISGRVLDLLSNLSGLDASEISNDTELPDIGIDSLMSMELARDIEKIFECSLDVTDMTDVTNVQSLIQYIEKTLGITSGDSSSARSNDESQNAPSSSSSTSTKTDIYTPSTSTTDSEDGVLRLPRSIVWDTFQESKIQTDRYILEHKFAGYSDDVMPKQTEMCIVHILDAFDQMGFSLRSTKPGQNVDRVPYHPRHERFVTFIYNSILKESGVLAIDGSKMTRTDTALPTQSAKELLDELLQNAPEHSYDHRLTYLAGCRLAEVFADTCDGIQLLFSSAEGRETVSGMYSTSPVNVVWIKQIEDLLRNLVSKLPLHEGPLKIFEMGAGTGGTTAKMVAILASLNVPVEYTVTDISPSLVAAARKRFKAHNFLKYQSYDIEKAPKEELFKTQHIVLATNCVHATHNLVKSTGNIHKLLRPDGFLMMLEMTETIPWIDLVFGTLEGWWLFDDGREHALVRPELWKERLQSVGYGEVDWTAGKRPESNIQRIIIAFAS